MMSPTHPLILLVTSPAWPSGPMGMLMSLPRWWTWETGQIKYCKRVKVSVWMLSWRREKSTYSSTGSKGLEDTALGIGLDKLINGVLALGNLNLTSKSLAGEV